MVMTLRGLQIQLVTTQCGIVTIHNMLHAVLAELQWNQLCTMNILGPIISVLFFQVSLYNKAAPFGTITKYVDYTGVLIFKSPD